MEGEEPSQTGPSLYAKFYRFLDGAGAVLSPPNPRDVGPLGPEAETQLILKKLPERQQIGYIRENADHADEIVDEVVAVPIFSTETGDVISALVVGFKPFELIGKGAGAGTKSGIWLNGHLHLPALSKPAQAALGSEIAKAITNSASEQNNFTVTLNNAPELLFYKRLNPSSLFPPAYEICVELAALLHQTHRLSGVIDDLLLLSRMDAGHLELESQPVNLSQIIEEWLDDLGALPDSPDVKIERDLPIDLYIAGEKRYTSLIVQNLLENARRYNRPDGIIRVTADREWTRIVLEC